MGGKTESVPRTRKREKEMLKRWCKPGKDGKAGDISVQSTPLNSSAEGVVRWTMVMRQGSSVGSAACALVMMEMEKGRDDKRYRW